MGLQPYSGMTPLFSIRLVSLVLSQDGSSIDADPMRGFIVGSGHLHALITACKQSLGQGNIFRFMCQSFCRQGGGRVACTWGTCMFTHKEGDKY